MISASHMLALLEPEKDLVNVAAGAFVFLLMMAAGYALLLLLMAVMPNLSGRAARKAQTRPFLSPLTGLAPLVLTVLFVGVAGNAPVIGIAGLALLTPLTLLGLASVSEALGRKVFLLAGREGSRPVELLVGWPLVVLASSIPFVGWFIIYPYVLLVGMGSVILSVFSSEEP